MKTMAELCANRAIAVDCIPTERQTREASLSVAGSFYLGNYYMTHTRPGKTAIVYIHHSQSESILEARSIATRLTERDTRGWTYTQIAREIMDWLSIRQSPYQHARELIPRWHFQLAKKYESDNATLFDLKSAYWQSAERCRSPKFSLSDDRVIFHSLSSGEETRWKSLLAAVKPHKKLRLALIGINAAGCGIARGHFHGTIRYSGGNCYECAHPAGALQPMSLLAVRTTYEVTQIQAQLSDTFYANADCVASESETSMQYWESVGLAYAQKGRGHATVNRIGAWRFGDQRSGLFHDVDPFARDSDPPLIVETPFHRQVLTN